MILTYSGKDSMLQEKPKDVFNYWVVERLQVLENRNKGMEKPWSPDPIMQNTYFTNVNREEDKTTKFIRHWANGVEYKYLPYWYTFARMINWIPALSEVDPIVDSLKDAIYLMNKRRDGGGQVFSGAYLITTCGEKMDKLDYVWRVCDHVKQFVKIHPRLDEQWQDLTKIKGLGNFLAAQVVADLKNTKGTVWSKADDWNSFVVPGPGSTKGMNYYMERALTKNIPIGQFKGEIEEARWYLEEQADKYIPMCNQDLQNCFCEFSKYMRILKGEGRSKRKYQGL